MCLLDHARSLLISSDVDRAGRIHITGGPGSGKTRLAQALGRALNLPVHDLDGIGLDIVRDMPRPLDMQALIDKRLEAAERLAATDAWVSECSNTAVATPLFDRADIVVLLRCSWRVASYRIVVRHVKATLARNNRFPGWLNLYRFWRWSGRFYADRNPHTLNEWGTPATQAYLDEVLRPYVTKLRTCTANRDIKALIHDLTD